MAAFFGYVSSSWLFLARTLFLFTLFNGDGCLDPLAFFFYLLRWDFK